MQGWLHKGQESRAVINDQLPNQLLAPNHMLRSVITQVRQQ